MFLRRRCDRAVRGVPNVEAIVSEMRISRALRVSCPLGRDARAQREAGLIGRPVRYQARAAVQRSAARSTVAVSLGSTP
jgi:hypothetical protein